MLERLMRAHRQIGFRTRASGRDADTDRARVAAIAGVIERTLDDVEAERAGLARRMENVRANAAMAAGNEIDEYSTRESEDNHRLHELETELANGERRLKKLEADIGHFRFLKAALATRFPEQSAPAPTSSTT